MLHPCPLWRIRTPSSSFNDWDREGCYPGWEGCSGSLCWESFPVRLQKARLGERHSLGFSASRGAVCCRLPLPKPTPRSRCLGCTALLLPDTFIRDRWIPVCSPPCSLLGSRLSPSIGQPGCAAELRLCVGTERGSTALLEPCGGCAEPGTSPGDPTDCCLSEGGWDPTSS